jgi:hypothetical protein
LPSALHKAFSQPFSLLLTYSKRTPSFGVRLRFCGKFTHN